jgi:NADPH:quinone reductase-like Zn-dependent oxidoreductase
VGEIVGKGAEVKGFGIGHQVSGEGHILCDICRSGLAGRGRLCTQALGLGVHRDGCFAEYLCLPVSHAWHADQGISSEIAAIFDPFGNVTHATKGIYGREIGFSYPVVPKGQARIRGQISPAHTRALLDKARNTFETVGETLGVVK